MAITTMIGARIHRREDPRLVSGEGRYVDDFTRPGTLSLSVVRSPFAHARVKSIDVTQATKAPGVIAIYTHKDIAAVNLEPTGASFGKMPIVPSFLSHLRELTSLAGTILVFDEVVTGFWYGWARMIERRPRVPALLSLATVVAIALPWPAKPTAPTPARPLPVC